MNMAASELVHGKSKPFPDRPQVKNSLHGKVWRKILVVE